MIKSKLEGTKCVTGWRFLLCSAVTEMMHDAFQKTLKNRIEPNDFFAIFIMCIMFIICTLAQML